MQGKIREQEQIIEFIFIPNNLSSQNNLSANLLDLLLSNSGDELSLDDERLLSRENTRAQNLVETLQMKWRDCY